MGKGVKVIPATKQIYTSQPRSSLQKRKTAGYARVSTDRDEQQTSYEAQVKYYTEYIKSRKDWEFVEMYTDEGISATSTTHRDGFNRMVEDALAGKIDLIITKSVSRFARNTVDSLKTIRTLKENGTEVYFEKENIWTFDAKGELLITIMSSLAQEESRSISENTTWGTRKRFAEGKVSVCFPRFLGYDAGFKINEEQAETVRLIYKMYLSGLSCFSISKKLEEMGRLTATGKSHWCPDVVQSVLTNEKYKGAALMQKTFTLDYLTKKVVKNTGELEQYYLEEHHDAIIDAETFDLVQAEMQHRSGKTGSYSGVSIFSSKIICGECGCYYGSKVWHSKDKYKKVIWRCNHKYRKGYEGRCGTPRLTEDEIKEIFRKALSWAYDNKDDLMDSAQVLIEVASDVEAYEDELDKLNAEIALLQNKMDKAIAQNATVEQEQDEYERMYSKLEEKSEEAKEKAAEISQRILNTKATAEIVRNFVRELERLDGVLPDFSESLWGGMIESITVFQGGQAKVKFKGGFEYEIA